MTPDGELLRQYAEAGDEAAFAELVRRHLPLVYITALRLVAGNAPMAQDVAQAVFTDLARKASGLSTHATLVGWLHTSTRFQASKTVRGEQRRQAREQEAARMSDTITTPEVQWEQLRPFFDDVLAQLPESDRDAVLLRYFEEKSYAEVGEILGLEPSAAHKRVERAVDKMRDCFARSGITASAALLATVISAQAATPVPADLAAEVTGAAIAGVSTAGKAAAATAAAKGLAMAKGTGFLSTLGTLLWPAIAIFGGLFVSVDAAIQKVRSSQEGNSASNPHPPMFSKSFFITVLTLLIGFAAFYYGDDYPISVLVILAGFGVVYIVVRVWLSPPGAKISALRDIGGTIFYYLCWLASMFAARYYWITTFALIFTLGFWVRYRESTKWGRPKLWQRALSSTKIGGFALAFTSETGLWPGHGGFLKFFVCAIIISGLIIAFLPKTEPESGEDSKFRRRVMEARQQRRTAKSGMKEAIRQLDQSDAKLTPEEKKKKITELRSAYTLRRREIARASLGNVRLFRAEEQQLIAEACPHLPNRAFEYRSRWTLFNLPLVHINFGRKPSGDWVTAKGWLAIGTAAVGVVAIGNRVAIGVVSVGGLMSFGVVGMGAMTFAPIAFGVFAMGIVAVGVLAIGYLAMGAGAIGLQAANGGAAAFALHYAQADWIAEAYHAHDAAARAYFADNWLLLPQRTVLGIFVLITLPMLFALYCVDFFYVKRGFRRLRALREYRAKNISESASKPVAGPSPTFRAKAWLDFWK